MGFWIFVLFSFVCLFLAVFLWEFRIGCHSLAFLTRKEMMEKVGWLSIHFRAMLVFFPWTPPSNLTFTGHNHRTHTPLPRGGLNAMGESTDCRVKGRLGYDLCSRTGGSRMTLATSLSSQVLTVSPGGKCNSSQYLPCC